jgi:elongation factor G
MDSETPHPDAADNPEKDQDTMPVAQASQTLAAAPSTAPKNGHAAAILKLRNLGIIAHIDAGKTTVTERILFYTGKIHKMGEVHEGSTTTDYMPEERERGITITAAAISSSWQGYHINLIDTPGHIDFTAEVQRSLRVLDGAVVVFSGVDGVEAQSETVWRQADRYHIPRLCFINKMDRSGADIWPVVEQIKQRLGARVLVMQMPLGKEGDFRGVIDLLRMKQLVFDKASNGEKIIESEIDEPLLADAEKHHEELFHEIADLDHEIGEIFLNDQKPTFEQLHAALRRITLTGKAFPVLCGSAYHFIGVQPVLDAVVAYLPSPRDVGHIVGHDIEDHTQRIEREPYRNQPLAALGFKCLFDKHGDLTFVRVYSGVLKSGERVYNPVRQKRERIDRMYLMHADDREMVEEAGPGEIVAVAGLKFTYTGDTLCDEEKPISLEAMHFPDTVVSMAIEPKTTSDKDRLAQALVKLSKEDPTFKSQFNDETGQLIIGGMGELHLEIIKSKLIREHSVDANMGSPRVSYRETITRSAEAEGRFIQQTGGHGQFGIAKIRIEPFVNDEDDHIAFESEIKGGAIPREYIKSVEHGVRTAAGNGFLGGYQLINIKIVLFDGQFHEVDSSDLAFEMAGSYAFKSAMEKAGAVLLEPIMSLEVVTPEEFLGNIIGDLNARRAEIREVGDRGHLKVVNCRVPLSEMFRYANVSRSLSSGRATYSMEPHEYEIVPRSKYKSILGDDFNG